MEPCQVPGIEKFVDALLWVIVPVFLFQKGVGLPGIGWIVGVHGFVRGVGVAMGLSGGLPWRWAEETHPRPSPAGP